MSGRSIDYLEIEIAPLMRASVVENPAKMQWEIDVITLSNARRWGNFELFDAKRESCIEKIRELPMTLQIVKRQEELIRKCMDPTFWDGSTEESLDEVIEKLGPLMKHRDPALTPFRVLDLKDEIKIRTWLEIDGKPVPKSAYQEISKAIENKWCVYGYLVTPEGFFDIMKPSNENKLRWILKLSKHDYDDRK